MPSQTASAVTKPSAMTSFTWSMKIDCTAAWTYGISPLPLSMVALAVTSSPASSWAAACTAPLASSTTGLYTVMHWVPWRMARRPSTVAS